MVEQIVILNKQGQTFEAISYGNTMRTNEEQYCKYCGKWKPFNEFEEGRQNCKKCIEYRRANHNKHRDKVNEEQRIRYKENEEYRKKKQEQRRLFDNKVVFCCACKKSMSQKYFYDHIKTKKHQNNLENQ